MRTGTAEAPVPDQVLPPRRGPLARAVLAVLVLAAFAILVGLGTWQLQRLAWKEALIAAAAERPTLPAVPAPGPDAWSSDGGGFPIGDWDYRRVSLSGRFGAAEAFAWTALSDPRGPLGGAGSFLVAPFVADDGFTVFVNRGFVPAAQREQAARPGSEPPQGPVTVEGIVRRDDPPNFATPAADPVEHVVFSRDIATLAELLGVQRAGVAPYTVDLVATETPAGGLPQAGESLVTFSNSHLQYALTWYGLAATLVGVVAAALWRRRSAAPPRAGG